MGNQMCCSPNNASTPSTMAKAPKVMVQHTIGLCNVALTYGQIIHEDVDAIVLVANTKLKLCAVTAKAMRQLGGPSVSEELNKILVREGGRLGFGQVVYTRAGDLDFDFIFYAVLPSCSDSSQFMMPSKNHSSDFQPSNSLVENLRCQTNVQQVFLEQHGNSLQQYEKQHVFECILNTLQLADELGLTSISFPVMEPMTLHISKSLIATITLVAIKTYIKETKRQSLNKIHIAIQDMPTMQLFKWAFQQIMIEGPDTPVLASQINSQTNQNHYLQVKGSLVQSEPGSFDAEQFIRFGHGITEKSTNKTEKSSL